MSGGAVNISGINGFLVVADHGDGTFNLSGGTMNTKRFNIGQNLEAGFSTRGVVNQSGGSVTAEFSWVIGEQSQSANLYDLSGGTITVVGIDSFDPGDLNVASSADSRGTLMVRGTGVAKLANSAMLGNSTGSGGTLIVSGNGSLSLGTNGAGAGNLLVGVDGTGTFQASGGSVSRRWHDAWPERKRTRHGHADRRQRVVVKRNMTVGEASTGNNVYDISGGTLSVGSGTLAESTLHPRSRHTQGRRHRNRDRAVPGKQGAYAQTGGVASMGLVTGTGSISVSGGTLNATSITQGTLNISSTGTAKIAVNGTATGLSVVDSLSVSGSAAGSERQ